MSLTQIEQANEAIKLYDQIYGRPYIDSGSSSNPFGILFILIGLFHIISPRTAWFLEIGWKLKNAEPSDWH